MRATIDAKTFFEVLSQGEQLPLWLQTHFCAGRCIYPLWRWKVYSGGNQSGELAGRQNPQPKAIHSLLCCPGQLPFAKSMPLF